MTKAKPKTQEEVLDAVAAEVSKPTHNIEQPPLRATTPSERVVRIAGLKFILPCAWAEGQVLDANSAAFINAAWHTAVINRFGPTKAVLLEKADTTYNDIDLALQAFYESFNWTPRPTTSGTEKSKKTEEDKALESFARPLFNKAMRGHGLDRKEYEALLAQWIIDNKAVIQKAYNHEQETIKKFTANLDLLLGE